MASKEEESVDNVDLSVKLKDLQIEVPSKHETKTLIRMRIWDLMEARNYVKDYPRPCHHRIPHFKQCGKAAEKLSHLNEFYHAKCVKINPSMAQMHLRYLTLYYGKKLLVPSPALGEAFMLEIDGKKLTKGWQFKRASSKAGAKELGTPLTVVDKFKIDFFVVASVACAPNGMRLGKGLGYAEIEWGILFMMKAVNTKTLVVTTVHDAQVLSEDELPLSLLSIHDLPVDIIVTPTRIINVRKRLPKPSQGVIWDLLTKEQLENIPVLKELKLKAVSA